MHPSLKSRHGEGGTAIYARQSKTRCTPWPLADVSSSLSDLQPLRLRRSRSLEPLIKQTHAAAALEVPAAGPKTCKHPARAGESTRAAAQPLPRPNRPSGAYVSKRLNIS